MRLKRNLLSVFRLGSTTVLLLLFATTNAQTFELVFSTPASASRSANFIDLNGDGWDDIFITNGPFNGQNNMLYLNNQNGSFIPAASRSPIVSDGDRSDGASFADCDNDGDLDGFVVTYGANGVGHKNYFYRGSGTGTFSYLPTVAMGQDLTYSETATWIDVNNDQLLDLYVTNSAGSLKNLCYINLGDSNFQKVTNLSITEENLRTRSVDWVDYDNDGDNDLFLTNENNSKNSLYRNDGANVFTKITNLSIVQDLRESTGSSWADIDNDGDFDLFVANSNEQKNQIFFNDNGSFTERTSSIIASARVNSYGSAFGDLDNDGDLDLMVCNAFLNGQNKNFIYINDGEGNFTVDNTSALANQEGWTFGCAFGDYNNDGWLDVILANTILENQTNTLYKNTGSGKNWVKLMCEGTTSNGSAVGAKVELKSTINGKEIWQTRRITSSSGYCGQSSFTQHFGLGDASNIQEIKVNWPSGLTETFQNLGVNNIYRIVEGSGEVLNINDVKKNNSKVMLFPNPVLDSFLVDLSNIQFTNKNLSLTIYDMSGKKVKTYFRSELHTYNSKVSISNLSDLSTGLYIFKIKDANKIIYTGKITKQ